MIFTQISHCALIAVHTIGASLKLWVGKPYLQFPYHYIIVDCQKQCKYIVIGWRVPSFTFQILYLVRKLLYLHDCAPDSFSYFSTHPSAQHPLMITMALLRLFLVLILDLFAVKFRFPSLFQQGIWQLEFSPGDFNHHQCYIIFGDNVFAKTVHGIDNS